MAKSSEAEVEQRQVPPLSAREERAWVPLVQAMLHLLATLDDELKQALDISHLDFGILILLQIAPQRRRRMTELATTFGVEPNVITYRVQRMEAHGWLRRTRSAADKRGVYAVLTAGGMALLEQATPLHIAGVRRHFLDDVSPAQLDVLAEVFGPMHLRQITAPAASADDEPDPRATAPCPASDAEPSAHATALAPTGGDDAER